MNNWIKIYEEAINELPEKMEEYTFWVNEILKDNAIPFQNRIDIRDERNNILEFGGCTNYLEVYVPKEYEKKVIDLLEVQEESNDGIEIYLKENEIRELENFENEKKYMTDSYNSERPSEEYIDKMKKIEKFEERKFWIFLGIIFFTIVIGIILVYFSKSHNDFFVNYDMSISMVVIIFSIFLLISIFLDKCLAKHIEKVKERIKSEYVVPIIRKTIYPYQYSTKGITEEFFGNTFIYEEFDHYNIYKSYDKITGENNGREFLVSNIYLKYEEFLSYSRYMSYHEIEWVRLKKDIGNFFDGIFIKTRISNTINSRVYIEPIKWWENCKNYMEYSEALSKGIHNKKYYLNSANIKDEFENNFRIYEMGEQKNSEILNEKFMEEILKLKEKYNKDISICISSNIANIMINDLKLLDEKIFIEQGLNTENILKSINLVEEVINIVKDFNIIEKIIKILY